MSIKEQKAWSRSIYLREAKCKSEAERRGESSVITERFLSLPEYKAAQVVFSYMSMDYEVDTSKINEAALADGKSVYVPRIEDGNMEFVRLTADSAFSVNEYGINEIIGGEVAAVAPDLVIVPLVAWDADFRRLGHGKGYYDRFLEGTGYKAVGLGYMWQSCMMEELPSEEHDVKLDILITASDYNGVDRR